MRIFQDRIYLPACIKMVITPLVINIFFMQLAPLDSAHTELSMLKTQFYEISRVVPFLRAGHISTT